MNFNDALEAVRQGTSTADAAQSVVAEMTEDERLRCLSGDGPFWAGLGYMTSGGYHRSPFPAAAVERLGVPGFAFSDGPRGVVVDHATCFPVSMARGATWDPDLEERIGEAIGQELRAVGATLYGGVCVNLLRHPAWGRAQETYGEDPHHVGEMGAALTRGIQRHAMACVKHFACNSMENARFRVDVLVDDEALHEVYLQQFRRIIDEGVACVMSAYNQVNGEWCGESPTLLTEILRDQWNFTGFVISDWIFGLRDAGASVSAGLDVEMPYRMIRWKGLHESIGSGAVSWPEIDRCVEHVVATLLRFDEVLSSPRPPRSVLANADHRALAREVAARSAVLLRNEAAGESPVLPWDPESMESLAVIGHLADTVNLGDGGSSDVWASEAITVLDGARAGLPGVAVRYDDGSDVAAAAAVAGASRDALVVVGYTFRDEGEFIGEMDMAAMAHLFPGPDDPDDAAAFTSQVADTHHITAPDHVSDRSSVGFATGGDRLSIRLSSDDVGLIRAVAAANPRTVVAIVAGSAVVMAEWMDEVPAIVQSWYGGMEAGAGLIDVLTGRVEVSGRLPFTVPTTEEHLPEFDRDADEFRYDGSHGWWHLEGNGDRPAFPFGFGLTYTEFAWGPPAIATDRDGIVVEVEVLNQGARGGAEVVQVYARPSGSKRSRRLISFERCEVGPGESRTVRIEISSDRLATWDGESRAMTTQPGAYEIQVARHACEDVPTTMVEIAP